MPARARFLLGCDIGGTFTDFVLLDEASGRFEIHKVLTTPKDPSDAVDQGLADLDRRHPGFLGATGYVIHGTTLVINALLERKGAATAILATKGFRDSLEMRKEIRYDIYDIGAAYPKPLVPRRFRREVTERLYADGRVRTPLAEAEACRVIEALADEGIESLAVCLLHAYVNPAHEQAVARIAADVRPELSVSLSSDVMPEIGEYERTSTTAINAYVKPLMAPYIRRLESRLGERGFERSLFLMLSGGGITSPEIARAFPVRLIESGPVGGALAVAHLVRQAGLEDAIVFDMGGTTAKACLLKAGEPLVTTTYEVDRVHRFKKGSGTPVGVPTVDIIEIGAGGGSIAGINRLGLLQVGPHSAGADPGPICYGRGGTAPTVTDADLVLGYLDPAYFLGGQMALDVEGAKAGIRRAVGDPLGFPLLDAAFGIHEVVNENMASAIRMYVAEKGGDFGKTAVIAFGGAGPVHADNFARRLGARRLVVPRGAGVFAALGFLVAPVSYEVARTRMARLDDVDAEALHAQFDELEREAAEVVRRAVPGADVEFAWVADMWYAGQGTTVRVPLAQRMDPADIRARFLDEYGRRYGYVYEDLEIQLVTLRVTASTRQHVPEVALPFADAAGGAEAALKGERPAFASEVRAMVPHRVYDMARLPAGARFEGPAIVEETSSTLVVGPGGRAEVDPRGWIMVSYGGDQA